MDVGIPITVSDPDGEAGQAYLAMARKVADELGPRRRYNKALRIG
jgi:hypothetical protein